MKSLSYLRIVMMGFALLIFAFGQADAGMVEKSMKKDDMKSEGMIEKSMKKDDMKSEGMMEKSMKKDDMK